MKKKLFSIFFCFFCVALFGQQGAKKYPLIEHFTNSKCGVCGNRNPKYYAMAEKYKADIHHIAFHPSFPYSSCIFYQANTVGNDKRSLYYGVQGTPSIWIEGKQAPSATTVINETDLTAQLNKTSPVAISVVENSGANRIVKVKIKNAGITTSGTYTLFTAVVEKVVNEATSNGEKAHYDVFRKMLPDDAGQSVTIEKGMADKTFTFSYTLDAKWLDAQVYTVAYLQDPVTKEILNSGTKFDLVADEDVYTDTAFELYPNPAQSTLIVDAANIEAKATNLSVFNLLGQLVLQENISNERKVLNINTLPQGQYILQVKTDKGILSRKFVKGE
jgi:hypothetical protein